MSSMIRAPWLQRWHCSEGGPTDALCMMLSRQIASEIEGSALLDGLSVRGSVVRMVCDAEHSGDTLLISFYPSPSSPFGRVQSFSLAGDVFCGVL